MKYKEEKARLEKGIRSILWDLAENNTLTPLEKEIKIIQVCRGLLDGKALEDCGVSIKKHVLGGGKEFDFVLGTPLCCDPSSETYWSM